MVHSYSRRQVHPLAEDDFYDYHGHVLGGNEQDLDVEADYSNERSNNSIKLYYGAPSTRRNTNHKNNNNKETTLSTVLGPRRKGPRYISVELLERIFGYLSQASLRFCISLVCREWRAVCHRMIVRPGFWKPIQYDYVDDLVEKMMLKGVNWLGLEIMSDQDLLVEHSYFFGLGAGDQYREMWDYFVKAVVYPPPLPKCILPPTRSRNLGGEDENGDQKERHRNLLEHVREVRVRGDLAQVVMRFYELLPSFLSLESLDLQITSDVSIEIITILKSCPTLRHFHLSRPSVYRVTLIAGGEGRYGDLIGIANKNNPHPDPQERYRLISFRVDRIQVQQSVIERILLSNPSLKVFKLSSVNSAFYEGNTDMSPRIDRRHLFQLAAKVCPRLERFSIWIAPARHRSLNASDFAFDLIQEFFPHTKEMVVGIVPRTLIEIESASSQESSTTATTLLRMEKRNKLLEMFRQLTVLDISGEGAGSYEKHITMDELLHLTPNLKILLAKGASYRAFAIRYLPVYCKMEEERRKRERKQEAIIAAADAARQKSLATGKAGRGDAFSLKSIASTSAAVASPPTPPRIWACQSLKELELRVYGCFDDAFFYRHLVRQCPGLTRLWLWHSVLHVGQRLLPSDSYYAGEYVEAEHPTIKNNHKTRERKSWTTLVELQGLESLEDLQVTVMDIPGIISASGFGFLRRKVVAVQEEGGGWKEVAKMKKKKKKKEEEEEKVKGKDAKVVWPHLVSLRIGYRRAPHQQNFADVVSDLEALRPGVEFRFQQLQGHH